MAYHRLYDNWQLDHDIIIERMSTCYGMYKISHLNELTPKIYIKKDQYYVYKILNQVIANFSGIGYMFALYFYFNFPEY